MTSVHLSAENCVIINNEANGERGLSAADSFPARIIFNDFSEQFRLDKDCHIGLQ